MLSGNAVKTLRGPFDALHDPLRLTTLSGNGALVRSWSAFKSQMWRLQGYLTEKTLKYEGIIVAKVSSMRTLKSQMRN